MSNTDVTHAATRVLRRFATSPALRYFAGIGTQTLADVLLMAKTVHPTARLRADDYYDEVRDRVTNSPEFTSELRSQVKQFVRHYIEVCEDPDTQDLMSDDDQALAATLKMIIDG
ncbi:hypothetical protein [Verrucomicrobium spinosum]|uniref:hypothetical protein n=1 Tax=Verrucomicrobium spinosum TaxID=2736 RepID=UPI00017463EC|nr:hypothetical protein [Verrucomicrobium spinosum]